MARIAAAAFYFLTMVLAVVTAQLAEPTLAELGIVSIGAMLAGGLLFSEMARWKG